MDRITEQLRDEVDETAPQLAATEQVLEQWDDYLQKALALLHRWATKHGPGSKDWKDPDLAEESLALIHVVAARKAPSVGDGNESTLPPLITPNQ